MFVATLLLQPIDGCFALHMELIMYLSMLENNVRILSGAERKLLDSKSKNIPDKISHSCTLPWNGFYCVLFLRIFYASRQRMHLARHKLQQCKRQMFVISILLTIVIVVVVFSYQIVNHFVSLHSIKYSWLTEIIVWDLMPC